MTYKLYYRKENGAWKRASETYRNKKGLLAGRDMVFETKEEAEEKARRYSENGYETKIK